MFYWQGIFLAVYFLIGCLAKKDKEPYFTSPIANVTVALGREAVLSCSVANLESFKVGWMRAEDQTVLSLHKRVVTHNSRVSVSTDGDTTWRLHIRQVKESDRGCYMCQINTIRMSKQSGCLDVQVPPDILDSGTSSDVSVDEGGNITLVCQARGHPRPKIQWRREDNNFIPNTLEDVFYGDALTLYNVDRNQVGAYLCIAANDVPPAVSKRIALYVNYAPEVRISHEVVGAPVGTDIRIFCYIKGYPPPSSYWTYRNSTIPQSGHKRVVGVETGFEGGVTLSLTLYKLEKEDFDTYTCQGNNSHGISLVYFRLYEVKHPTTTPEIITSTSTTTTTTTTLVPEETTEIITLHDNDDYNNIEVAAYDNELQAKGVGARSSPIAEGTGSPASIIIISPFLFLLSCIITLR